jgi:hypothetical protein
MQSLQELLVPYHGGLVTDPVSIEVNNPRSEAEALIRPLR